MIKKRKIKKMILMVTHDIIGHNGFIIKIENPTDLDINYAIEILTTFRHREYIEKKFKKNMAFTS
jgi:hypothetical protein